MAKHNFSGYLDTQEVLEADEAIPYLEVFGDRYWWGAPELEARRTLRVVKADTFGRLLLEDCEKHNGGMQRLQDTTASFEAATLEADDYGQGQVVRVVHESLMRSRDHYRQIGPEVHTAAHTESGYIVTRNHEYAVASYSMIVRWFIVTAAKRKQQGFFELDVDHDQSYSSRIEDSVRPVLKIRGYSIEGVPALVGGATEVTVDPDTFLYERIRLMSTYMPMQVGRRSTGIDTDISNSRPV